MSVRQKLKKRDSLIITCPHKIILYIIGTIEVICSSIIYNDGGKKSKKQQVDSKK